jgi:hypothetical protein
MKSRLTRTQSLLFLAFIALMLTDLVVTLWGYQYYPGFVEANPLFNVFTGYPALFITAILWMKVVVIGFLLLAVIWFNQYDHDTSWQGGNILISTATVGMELMLGALVVGNVILVMG